MALTKQQRAVLREKFGGKCAYCGGELGERWHADHIENVDRVMKRVPGKGFVCTGKMHKPERDTLENMNPACAPCNIDKHSMTLNDWRGQIERSNGVLMRDVPTFRRAVRYGLVQLNSAPVVFYFERLDPDKAPIKEGFSASTSEELDAVFDRMASEQKPMPHDMAAVLAANSWDLFAR